MNYKRTCRDCGATIRYSDEDEYIICPTCGRKTLNPHYEEIVLDDDDFVEEYRPVKHQPVQKRKPAKKQSFIQKLMSNKKKFITIVASVSAVVLIGLITLLCFAIPSKVDKSDAKKALSAVMKEMNNLDADRKSTRLNSSH